MPGPVVRIDVHPPIKTADRYEFRCDVSGKAFSSADAVHRLKSVLLGFGSPWRTRLRFGFRTPGGRLPHAEVWDSVFPLLFLTRKRGPLFKTRYDTAVIRFHYPILERVREFLVRRAANCGLSISVEADTFERTYDIRGAGHVQAFGGGKESRLIYGLLRDTGRTPRLSTGGVRNRPRDLSPVEISEPLAGVLGECLMPGLMSGAAHFYFGGSMAAAHLHRPWHQYYDFASPQGVRELSDLLQSLGIGLTLHSPLVVLPYNLTQKILMTRYPELAAHQVSVSHERATEKNLCVSLLKLYHGAPIAPQCSDQLFRRLADEFVTARLARPHDFGFNAYRMVAHREMMAIMARRADHPVLDTVRPRIPSEWDESWIDFIHTYMDPDPDPALLEIFREYAQDYEPAAGDFRVAVPDARESMGRA